MSGHLLKVNCAESQRFVSRLQMARAALNETSNCNWLTAGIHRPDLAVKLGAKTQLGDSAPKLSAQHSRWSDCEASLIGDFNWRLPSNERRIHVIFGCLRWLQTWNFQILIKKRIKKVNFFQFEKFGINFIVHVRGGSASDIVLLLFE